MTATGSHIDFGFAARSTTLQGKAFSLSRRLLHRFLPLKYRYQAGGAYPAPTRPNRAFLKNISASRFLGWRLCFSSASGFWEDVAVSRQFSFSVSGDDNGRFLGERKRSSSETQFILPIAVIHGHARKVPIIRDVAVAHTVSLIDQKDTCN